MWVRDRLITSFNIYVYFPCKNIYIEKKNYDGVKIAGKLILVFYFFGLFTWDFLKKNALLYTTTHRYIVCSVVYKHIVCLV